MPGELIPAQKPSLPWAPDQPIQAARLEEMRTRPITEVNIRGRRVKSVRTGSVLTILFLDDGRVPQFWRWAKILSADANGDNKWNYHFAWQRETTTGWEDDSDASDPEDNSWLALNSFEANNASTGIQGNGVDLDDPDLTSTTTILPIQGEPVVQIWIGTDTDGNATYRFSAPNEVDISCPGGGGGGGGG